MDDEEEDEEEVVDEAEYERRRAAAEDEARYECEEYWKYEREVFLRESEREKNLTERYKVKKEESEGERRSRPRRSSVAEEVEKGTGAEERPLRHHAGQRALRRWTPTRRETRLVRMKIASTRSSRSSWMICVACRSAVGTRTS